MLVYLEPIAPPGPPRPVVGGITLGRGLFGGVGTSEAHARLDASGSHCTLRDLGSTNGTFAGGVRLRSGETRVLADGNEIRIGDVRLIVRISPTRRRPEPVPVVEEVSPFGGHTGALAREHLGPSPVGPAVSRDAAASKFAASPGREEEIIVDFAGPMVLVAHQGLPPRGLVLGDGMVHTVGREGDLAIDDPTVSTAHAEIRRYGLQVLLRDVGSKHGVQIGGQPVEPRAWQAWRHGAVVTLGRAVLVLTGIPAPSEVKVPSGDTAKPALQPVLQPEPRRDPPRELPPPRAPNWQAFSDPASRNAFRRGELHELALGDPDGPTHVKPRNNQRRTLAIFGAFAALAVLLGVAGLVLYRFAR